MSLTTIALTTALKVTANPIFNQITKVIKRKCDELKILNDISDKNEVLVNSITKLIWVKTLLSGSDNPVNLFDFFLQPKLSYKNKIFSIENIEEITKNIELTNSNNIIFQGTVGQGKSIFLRALAIEDFLKNERIPIFIELKNISHSKGLIGLIQDYLNPWIGNNDELLKVVLSSEKVSIFLDAFDEVEINLYKDVYTSIENLAQNYPSLNIILTSRPGNVIQESNHFSIISLCPYSFDEQKGLIKKVVKNEENEKILIDSISKSSIKVQAVLTTPLMVMLYIRRYGFDFTVPKDVSDFYKDIFEVVTFKHDHSKGIEKRSSFSNLNQDQLERVFSRFCFETFLIRKNVFDKNTFINLLKKSVHKCQINVNAEIDFSDLIKDYTRFACLILKDGLQYTFIHKSIQEYYVAYFICNLPEKAAINVLDVKFLNPSNDLFLFFNANYNSNYLEFLKVLKPYFYNKFYLLPGLCRYKSEIDIDFKTDDINFKKFLSTMYISKKDTDKTVFAIYLGETSTFFKTYVKKIKPIVECLERNKITSELGKMSLLARNENENFLIKKNVSSLKDFINNDYEELYLLAKKLWEDICQDFEKLVTDIDLLENPLADQEFDF